jgi:DDE superfamily endonuclease
VQSGKYGSALASDLPSRNGWSVAEHAGDQSQRLLSRASWDEAAAMSQVRKYAAAGLDEAARRPRRKRMTAGALDETGQEKQGSSTSGVKRQYMGCAGRVSGAIPVPAALPGGHYQAGNAHPAVINDAGSCFAGRSRRAALPERSGAPRRDFRCNGASRGLVGT